LFYGFAVNYSKRRLAGIRPLVVAFGSQFFASIVLIPLALLSWPRHSVMPLTWLCVAALGMLCTGFAYVLFFRLVEHVGAAYAASVTFLIPLFGVAWGALFLDEKITPRIRDCGGGTEGAAAGSYGPLRQRNNALHGGARVGKSIKSPVAGALSTSCDTTAIA